jgi:hypothetical protein
LALPQASYNSGVSAVDAAARAALIKPIGSENQLQKLSVQKAGVATGASNSKHVASPNSRKSQIKTEANWTNKPGKPNEKSGNFFNNKVGSFDAKLERNENINVSNNAQFAVLE